MMEIQGINNNPLRSAKRGTEILLYCCRMGKLKFFRDVSVILDWLDGKLDWSIFAVVIPIGATAMLLMGLLTFVWEFDLAVSPAWQVGIFPFGSGPVAVHNLRRSLAPALQLQQEDSGGSS